MIADGKLVREPNTGRLIEPDRISVQALEENNEEVQNQSEPDTDPSVSHGSEERDYYTTVEVAQRLNKPYQEILRMDFQEKLPVKFVGDQRVFSKQAIDDMVPNEAATSASQNRAHSPNHRREEESRSSSQHQATDLDGSSGQEKGEGSIGNRMPDVTERQVMDAAKKYETSINKIKQMVAAGELVIDPVSHELVEVEAEQKPEASSDNKAGNDAEYRIHATKKAAQRLNLPFDEVQRRVDRGELVPDPKTEHLSPPDEGESDSREEELEKWVSGLQEELRAEREDHQKDIDDAQYEIDQLDAELENLRRSASDSTLDSRLQQETYRREAAERQARELESHLETSQKEYEEALALERQKARQLEDEVQKLTEVRRILGEEREQPPGSNEETESASSSEDPSVSFEELRIDTRHGLWVFHPPFALGEEEIELIRLVAGEDEITAEQITQRTGRWRAAGDLEDLLDRLADEGLKPIEENNDRYSFDPNFLQE